MNPATMKIAVLMRPIDHTDQWITTVVCDHGCNDMLGTTTFGQAITAATDALNAMVTHCQPAPRTVEVWTVMASTEILDRFEHQGHHELFQLLHKVPANLIDISHRVITLTDTPHGA